MDWFEKRENNIIINVRVVPRAAKDGVAGLLGTEALKIRIQAPPVEGKANAYLVKYLSKRWKISRSNIKILSGETGRNKRIQISNPSQELLNELNTLTND